MGLEDILALVGVVLGIVIPLFLNLMIKQIKF